MRFSDSSGTPLFQQVADQIADLILEGSVKEGQQVPSTTQISTAYRLNPATVLKGMNLLASKGYLIKKRGIGMFVAPGARQKMRLERINGQLRKQATSLARQAKILGLSQEEFLQLVKGAYDERS